MGDGEERQRSRSASRQGGGSRRKVEQLARHLLPCAYWSKGHCLKGEQCNYGHFGTRGQGKGAGLAQAREHLVAQLDQSMGLTGSFRRPWNPNVPGQTWGLDWRKDLDGEGPERQISLQEGEWPEARGWMAEEEQEEGELLAEKGDREQRGQRNDGGWQAEEDEGEYMAGQERPQVPVDVQLYADLRQERLERERRDQGQRGQRSEEEWWLWRQEDSRRKDAEAEASNARRAEFLARKGRGRDDSREPRVPRDSASGNGHAWRLPFPQRPGSRVVVAVAEQDARCGACQKGDGAGRRLDLMGCSCEAGCPGHRAAQAGKGPAKECGYRICPICVAKSAVADAGTHCPHCPAGTMVRRYQEAGEGDALPGWILDVGEVGKYVREEVVDPQGEEGNKRFRWIPR